MKLFKYLVVIFLAFYLPVSADNILDNLEGIKVNFNFSFDNKEIKFKGVSFDFGGISNNTEALFSFDNSKNEFCCDREYTYESAQDMSQEESNRIVQRLLNSSESYKPNLLPTKKGQR